MLKKLGLNKLNISRALYVWAVVFIISLFTSVNMWLCPIIAISSMVMVNESKKRNFVIKAIVGLVEVVILSKVLNSSILGGVVAWIVTCLVLFIMLKSKKEKSAKDYIQSAFVLIYPMLIMLLTEFMQENLGVFFFRISSGISSSIPFIITMLYLWLAYLAVVGITGNKRVSLLIVSIPVFVLSFANMIVLYLTMQPLKPSDFATFSTAMSVVEDQRIDRGLLFLIIASIICIVLLLVLICKVFSKSKVKRDFIKTAVGVMSIAIIWVFMGKLNYLNFQAHYSMGYICYFTNELYDDNEEPWNYEEQSISTKLNTVSEEGNSEVKPNVIIVMSEAFSDLSSVYGFETSEDYMPYFRSLQEKYPNGIAYSSVYGNNTCSSELETLTGISTGFTEKGANIYQRKVELSDNFYSIGDLFKQNGYKTAFFHPYERNNYNRADVYTVMDYDELIFLDDLSEDAHLVRRFVSDKENFSTIYNRIENSEEPLFMMNVTMQNHGGYTDELDISPYIEVEGYEGSDSKPVENYLSLIKKSDEYLEEFLTGLQELDEPTVVLFFGDHQPLLIRESNDFLTHYLGGDFLDLSPEEKEICYQVPYLMWSNYEVDSDYILPETTSMNYLSVLLNNYLGNENTEWLNFLEEVRSYYPVVTENFVIDKEGNITSMDMIKVAIQNSDGSDKGLELLKKYWYASYTLVENGSM